MQRLKSTSIFKEQTRIPLKLTIEEIWCNQKGNKFEQFLQISVHKDEKSTKKAIFHWKTSKSIHLWSNQFWNPIANVSVKVQKEKTSIKNLKHKRKKLIQITELTTPINTMKWKRSWSQFPSFMSEQFLSTRSKTYMHFKNFKFYLIFAVRKQISGKTSATNKQVHQQAPLASFKTKISQYTK